MLVIDTHSHIGRDYYFGNIELSNYIAFCEKIGINVGFLMPTAWPIYKDKEGNDITSLLWEHFDYKYKNYFRLINEKREEIISSPYQDVNEIYANLIKSYNGNIELFFVPLVHGILDSPEYIESIINLFKPKALKMHGFSGGFSPEEINPEITEVLRFYRIPLVLHTSVYNYDYGYGADTKFWRNECHPLRWAKYIVDNNLKGVLNHGACLSSEAIELTNKYEGLMIGIGPDLDLSKDFFKSDIIKSELERIGYLRLLKEKVLISKLLFDIDYSWNIDPETADLDYDSVNRITQIWNENDSQKLLSDNACQFYGLKKHR